MSLSHLVRPFPFAGWRQGTSGAQARPRLAVWRTCDYAGPAQRVRRARRSPPVGETKLRSARTSIALPA